MRKIQILRISYNLHRDLSMKTTAVFLFIANNFTDNCDYNLACFCMKAHPCMPFPVHVPSCVQRSPSMHKSFSRASAYFHSCSSLSFSRGTFAYLSPYICEFLPRTRILRSFLPPCRGCVLLSAAQIPVVHEVPLAREASPVHASGPARNVGPV